MTVKERVIERGFCSLCLPQVGPSAVPPRGRRRSGPVLSHLGVAASRAQCCPTAGSPQVGPSAVPPRGHRVRSWLGRGGHCTYHQQQQQQGAPAARAPRHRLAPPHPRLRTSPAPHGSSRPGPTRGRPSPPQPCPGCGSRCGRVRKSSRGPAREPGGGECAPRGGASQFPPSAPGAVTSPAGDLEWLAPPRRVSCPLPSSSRTSWSRELSSSLSRPQGTGSKKRNSKPTIARLLWKRAGGAKMSAGGDRETHGPRGVGPAVASEASVVSL